MTGQTEKVPRSEGVVDFHVKKMPRKDCIVKLGIGRSVSKTKPVRSAIS
jgi:hypothetical protein